MGVLNSRIYISYALADPDLQIRWSGGGGGVGHPHPEIRGRRSQRIFFRSFGPQFGLKIRGSRVLRAPPLDPPLLCKDDHFLLTRK